MGLLVKLVLELSMLLLWYNAARVESCKRLNALVSQCSLYKEGFDVFLRNFDFLETEFEAVGFGLKG
jgi:hypothetical protein